MKGRWVVHIRMDRTRLGQDRVASEPRSDRRSVWSGTSVRNETDLSEHDIAKELSSEGDGDPRAMRSAEHVLPVR